MEIAAPTAMDIGKLRSTLDEGGLKNFRVVQVGEPSENTYLVKVQGGEEEGALKGTRDQVEKILSAAPEASEGTASAVAWVQRWRVGRVWWRGRRAAW